MGIIRNPHIELKELLDRKDYDNIKELQELCLKSDCTALKLELDYKLGRADGKDGALNSINEFMYYDGSELIGYLGICHFGGDTLEVNGMVHPDYRRRGVFSKLFSLVRDEWDKREIPRLLLLSDHQSDSGLGFIRYTGAEYDFSEYEMYLGDNEERALTANKISLRKAANSDARELARLDSICFDEEYKEENTRLPEDEEKGGMVMYIAEVDKMIVGKVNLETSGSVCGIYGLGVLPEYRRKGYGRGILMRAVEKFKESSDKDIMLQVAVENENALNLYRSCGFEITSKMDYFRLSR